MLTSISTSARAFTAASRSSDELTRVAFTLDLQAHKQLLRVASAHHVSQQNAALALLTVLVYRYTGATALTVSTRDSAGVRLDLTDDTPFSSILDEIQRCPSLRAHGRESRRPRSKSRTARRSTTEFIVRGDAMRDLCVALENHATDLHVCIDYPLGPFPVLHDEDVRDHARRLLEHYVSAPEATLRAPSLLTEACAELLPNPRATLASPPFRLVHEAVFSWAERTPDAIAVRTAERDWTYAELADASRTLAEAISARVAPGDTVAVSGKRSFALVSAMLAVWRCGAVLLTLDPKLPRLRRELMVEQARVKLLVDVDSQEVSALAVPTPHAIADADVDPDAAYVFFTSGSTGTPKAVLGSHRGLAHFLAWQRETFAIRPSDRAAQLTGLSFDVVLRDMFLPLTSGASLCLPHERDVLDGSRLLPWLAAQRISLLHAVPSLATSWLEHSPDDADLSALRCVFFAGEPLTSGFVDRFRATFGNQRQLINLYGPTETTLAKCYHVLGDEPEPGVQPVGRPISHTQLLILDRERRLCGRHEPGEIAIRTPFRSLGYLDAEATARAFVQNPFGSGQDDLIYLTGDRGRYRHDGSIDILGRFDNQVKLRGVRVELGEIEATLLRHPDLAAAAVLVREDALAGTTLAAYVVPHSDCVSPKLTAELRAFLETRLPTAFIPHHFITRDALPLTPNGKLDRAALLARKEPLIAAPHVEPATQRERELAAQWARILQVPKVSTDASFYELGGDSLTAMRVLVRMRVFGFDEATCQAMLQGKTIAQIASSGAGDARPSSGAKLAAHERMRLILHVLRGLLLLSMLSDHYLWRFSRQWPWAREAALSLYEFFRFTTPSFAIVFGLSLGFVYYPIYLRHRGQARALLWRNALFVGTAGAAMLLASSPSFREWQLTYVAPLFWYYALAFASSRAWFRLIAASRFPRLLILSLAAAFHAIDELLQSGGGTPQWQDWLGLVHGKYGYFGMSSGVLLGSLIGIELKRDMRVRRGWWAIAALLVAYAVAQAPAKADHFAGIPLWHWALSAGCLISLMALLEAWFSRVREDGPTAARLRAFGLFGQLAFPIFVLHFWTQSVTTSLSTWLARPVLGLAADCLIVASLTWVMLRATNRLLYGVREQVES